jgi:hypothetical protein
MRFYNLVAYLLFLSPLVSSKDPGPSKVPEPPKILYIDESCKLSVGTVWRHEKVGRIVMVFKCLREESIYNVGASLHRLAAGRWDER